MFAQKKVTLPPGRHKIVILDEADRCGRTSRRANCVCMFLLPLRLLCFLVLVLPRAPSMTAGAQQALRRTMEIYSHTTRFALACNMSNKIIEPIQSRCAILRFTKLTDAQVLKRLIEVADMEKVPRTDEGLEAIVFTAEGDMRQALNNLQSTYHGFGKVDVDNVFKVCDQPHPLVVKVRTAANPRRAVTSGAAVLIAVRATGAAARP